ncbi:hypothetical protein AAT16_10470 [Salinicoccus halodurans]|uniref:Uncharacterized protein n=1 Tax=Salinicoccus halodurans TaxID=407035 RepID=A0ABM5TAH9_9STAP|nr:hypothetical protein AAT16_10470 [Salinicoccus halodurans]
MHISDHKSLMWNTPFHISDHKSLIRNIHLHISDLYSGDATGNNKIPAQIKKEGPASPSCKMKQIILF